MSHFQSLSAPFADKPSSSDGPLSSNHYLQNNPALLHHLISSSSNSSIRSKIAPLKAQRKPKEEEISFEEARRRALAATELALASPRTKAQFLEQELSWDHLDSSSSKTERPTTAQYYADGNNQNYALQSVSSPAESESSQTSYSSYDRAINEPLSPTTSEYTVKPLSSTKRPAATSSSPDSSPVTQQRANGTPQQRLNQLRSVPEGGSSSTRSGSSNSHYMASEISTAAPSARAGGPRSSSIDSAINNIVTHSQTGERTPDEIATLIQAAGSPEALISHLLKDKAQAASQNSQLWRLVDKQRSMILSLNRDLEKAMKDKERYRKKLKEQLNAVPPLPTGADVTRAVASPTPSDAHDTDTLSQDGRSSAKGLTRSDTISTMGDDGLAPYPLTPPTGGSDMASLQKIASEVMPDANQHIISDHRPANKIPSKLDLSGSKAINEPGAPTPSAPTPGLSRKKAPAPLQLQQSTQGYSVQRDIPDEKQPAASDLTEAQARHVLAQQEALISPGLPKQMGFGGDNSIKSTTLMAPNAGLSAKRGVNITPAALKSPALGIGLPLSPRPIDRPLASPMFSPRQPRTNERLGGPLSPPLSPRGMTGLPQSPRGGFAPLGGPLSPGILSPSLNGAFLTQMMQQPVGNIHEQLMAPLPQMSSLSKEVRQEEKAPGDFAKDSSSLSGVAHGGDEKLLIVPPALQTIDAKVLTTRVRPRGEKSRDQITFTMAVYSRTNGNELWRVEKDVNSLGILDSKMRQFANPKSFNAKLPNMTLFTTHTQANIDGRRSAIEEYFVNILNTIPLDQRAAQALCEYLSCDVVDSSAASDSASLHSNKDSISGASHPTGGTPSKEGYLRKRGKNFGGWKSRYFILEGPVLRYFETKGGSHLGSIRIPNAQIGKQSNAPPRSDNPDDNDNQYRHAFLVLEPKRNNPSSAIRHVLCAESDAERDEWVECLLQFVHTEDDHDDNASVASEPRKQSFADEKPEPPNYLRAVSYESMVQGQAPVHGPASIERRKDTPSPVSSVSKNSDGGEKNIITGIASTLGGKFAQGVASDALEKQKPKKSKGIWGFRQKHSAEPLAQSLPAPTKLPSTRSVFGAPLGDAVEISRPVGVDLAIPAVVYRCIEYLEVMSAYNEEGIFRLSGSNTVIRTLRERFNTHSDVNLNEEGYVDVHAVAGLLKLYLRELPTTILTRDLHGEFVSVLEDDDKINRVYHLNELVHKLPIENFTLLKLLASHLIMVTENADINKMTVKNVGIVFSPTLNIPAGVFSLFIMEFSSIFIRPGEEGYDEPTYDTTMDSQGNTTTTHLMAPPPYATHTAHAVPVGLPSTPRRMNFESSLAEEEKRRQNQEAFRALMENTRQEEARSGPMTPTFSNFQSGGSIGGSMSLNVPTEKKKKRESAMLGLFSSSKLSHLKGDKGKGHEMSPNPFDENSMYDV